MARIDTLTAYSCKFSYLQRNNPLIEEQRDAIKMVSNQILAFRISWSFIPSMPKTSQSEKTPIGQ